MRTLELKLTLMDDLVASERPATEGGHESLDYLPGAMLLGAAAARLYSGIPREHAFILFHSGKVRFGDATPLMDNLQCWPMPLCWHERKAEPALDGDYLDREKIRNFQHLPFAEGAQPKQLRNGYVRADGAKLTVQKRFRMKTAVNPNTGRVDESQMFGYEAIGAGQCFVARIEADMDLSDDLWNRLSRVFEDAGELLLGRSRSAEYGRVRAECTEHLWSQPMSAGANEDKRLTFWCLSDLALVDDYGQPTFDVAPKHFGLDRGKVDWSRSFLSFRRFAPWNAYRKAFDLERQVIRRGSVITITDMGRPLSDAERAGIEAGIGLHRESGMGRISIDPRLLADAMPLFTPRTLSGTTYANSPSVPDHPLVRWLKKQSDNDSAHRQAERQGRDKAAELKRCYQLARAYAGFSDSMPVGPSPAQWGSVYEKARLESEQGALRQALLVGENATCKPKGEGWEDAFCDAAGVRSFFDWFNSAVDDFQSVPAFRVFAREAQRVARAEQRRDNHRETTA